MKESGPVYTAVHGFDVILSPFIIVLNNVYSLPIYFLDGTVTLPIKTFKVQQGRMVSLLCTVTEETFVAWVTPAKTARPGRPVIPSVNIPASQTTTVNRKKILVFGDTYRLMIEDVIADDGGTYICEGSLNSAVFTLQVDCK